jgi:hypothetical protein
MNELNKDEVRKQLDAAYAMMEHILQPDDERLPLCADCADWERIPQALVGCAIAALTLVQNNQAQEAVQLMRTMAESLYALGYQRGQREAQQPVLQFVLAEEQR